MAGGGTSVLTQSPSNELMFVPFQLLGVNRDTDSWACMKFMKSIQRMAEMTFSLRSSILSIAAFIPGSVEDLHSLEMTS